MRPSLFSVKEKATELSRSSSVCNQGYSPKYALSPEVVCNAKYGTALALAHNLHARDSNTRYTELDHSQATVEGQNTRESTNSKTVVFTQCLNH